MTTFAGISQLSPTPVAPPVGPPGTPVGSPPPPPGAATPTAPLTGISATLVTDLTEASRLASRAVEMLHTLPQHDTGSEQTKDLRIRIHKTNMAVQSRLERQFDAGNSESVLSELRKADAYLEDANWQLARKPSPDGRFNGVDIPGAIRDTLEGTRIIGELLSAAGGTPSTPVTPPPMQPPTTQPPVTPPVPPVTPPHGGGGGTGDDALPPSEPEGPLTPPTPPTPDTPPTPPSGGDDDYPGEDEFPTDDRILGDT